MASVHRCPNSAYFHAAFRGPDGRLILRSTKQTDRNSALAIALELERAAKLATRGELVESQARDILADIMKRADTGETLRSVSIADHFRAWLATKEARKSAGTAARRVWLMDRGIPTEAVLAQMRASEPPVKYLVGTPKGALSARENELLDRPWERVRDELQVKLLPQAGEVYVLAHRAGRVDKERAIRRKQLRRLRARLNELRRQLRERDQLLMALGAAKKEAGRFYALLKITVPAAGEAVTPETFHFRMERARLCVVRRREGRYLLRSNLTDRTPVALWTCYMQLVQVEEAFKNLKGDLGVRPVFHQKMERIEAHILVAFVAYTLHVCLRQRLRTVAGGVTPRAVLEKFSAVQRVDVHLPTTDGREVILTRHTQPEKELQVLLEQLELTLPAQPPPKITVAPPALEWRLRGLRPRKLQQIPSTHSRIRQVGLTRESPC